MCEDCHRFLSVLFVGAKQNTRTEEFTLLHFTYPAVFIR